jgi:hypothetical protein
MKYTRSRDGVERANLYAVVRVTREEHQWMQARVKADGVHTCVRDLLNAALAEGLDIEHLRAHEEAKERRARAARKREEVTR